MWIYPDPTVYTWGHLALNLSNPPPVPYSSVAAVQKRQRRAAWLGHHGSGAGAGEHQGQHELGDQE